MPLYNQLRSSVMEKTVKNPEKLQGKRLIEYLIHHPDAQGNFQLHGITSDLIAELLIKCPQFAPQCDFSQITKDFTGAIIIAQPGLLNRFNPSNVDWKTVLCNRPELAKHLSPDVRLDDDSWIFILSRQPRLLIYSSLNFTSEDWARLIYHQPLLAGRCPWKTLNFNSKWRENILLYPDLILKHRKDWKKYYDQSLAEYSFSEIAVLISKAPHLETKMNDLMRDIRKKDQTADGTGDEMKWTVFQSREQMTILKSQPQFFKYCDPLAFNQDDWKELLISQPQLIKYCNIRKMFPRPPLDLLIEQPGLADHFNWKKCTYDQILMKFIQTQPQLAPRVLNVCRDEEWEYLLPEHPEYLLERDGTRFSFSADVRAFVAADFLDFDQTGLDTICNNVYDKLEKKIVQPSGWFAENDLDPADFLIKSIMDFSNAKSSFLQQMRNGRWQFFMDLLELRSDPDDVHSFLPQKEIAFCWCCFAPENIWRKYLDLCKNPVSLLDKNGNTLLHAALLRAAMTNVEMVLVKGSPHRAGYDDLIARGWDPDRKNKCGVSCRGLLAMIRKKVEYLMELYCGEPASKKPALPRK